MKFNKHAASIAAVVAAVCASAPAFAGGRADLVLAALESSKAQFVSGEVIVQMHRGISVENSRFGDAQVEMLIPGNGRNDNKGDLVIVKLPLGQTIAQAVRESQGDSTIDFVEPNWIYQHHATSNDTYATNGTLWGMYGDGSSPANQYGSQAAEAWGAGHTSCSNVVVGVIDEGIYYNHEDLAGNMWVNPYDTANGVDDDGNGYVDDTRGWDFDGGSNNINSGGVNDDHGTHVSGTIAGMGGNAKGVAGVCWSGIKVISAKFLGNRGGTTANAILAVDYLTDLKTRHGLNIVASNNSWGGGGFSQGLKDAIDRANNANILFVAAAGNETNNNDANLSYPGSYTSSNIISVASITSTGGLSSFSNYGATTVDIGAPGSAIMSTVPKRVKGALVSGYASYSGTSMATPHVTGAVALYSSSHAGATAAQIKAAIMGSAVATPSLSGKCVSGARLNASGF